MLAIVYRPKFEERTGNLMLHYPLNRLPVSAKGKKAEEIELDVLYLKRGTNFVQKDIWDLVSGHAPNAKAIEGMLNTRVLSVHTPDAAAPIGSTSDYENIAVVRDIVDNCSDVEWLKITASWDRRPGVYQILTDRIKDLQDAKKEKAQQGMMELI